MSDSVKSPARPRQLLVGTYPERLPHVSGKAEGIMLCTFAEGRVGPPSLVASVRNPAFITATPSGDHVYAASETLEFEGQPGGGLTAFSRDPGTGALHPLNTRPSGGEQPCYIAIDELSGFALVANYGTGSVAVFERRRDGSLGQMTDFVQHRGSGPDQVRQTGPHPHMVVFYPSHVGGEERDGKALVPDLGADAVFTYSVSPSGKLAEKREMRLSTKAGAGPRHLRFHPGGRHLFVLNELDSTLMVVRLEGARLVAVATVSTLAAGSSSTSMAAEVRVSLSGKYVFASNRGPGSDNIAMFAFDEGSETISLVRVEASRGEVPRDFTQSPDGRYLIVANQDTDTVVTFEIDEDEPGLKFVSETEVPTPVSLLFP